MGCVKMLLMSLIVTDTLTIAIIAHLTETMRFIGKLAYFD